MVYLFDQFQYNLSVVQSRMDILIPRLRVPDKVLVTVVVSEIQNSFIDCCGQEEYLHS
jgi:hypothetical protein